MRCFLGVELTEEVKEKISPVLKDMEGIDGDIKTVDQENLHITVKFLGDIEESDIQRINPIEKITTDLDPFEVKMGGMRTFPSQDYIKVVWIDLKKGNEKFVELISRIENKLHEHGFSKDKNEPMPHATVARVKSGRNKEKIKSIIEKWKNSTFGDMVVDKVTLFQSELTPEGPVYERIKNYRL